MPVVAPDAAPVKKAPAQTPAAQKPAPSQPVTQQPATRQPSAEIYNARSPQRPATSPATGSRAHRAASPRHDTRAARHRRAAHRRAKAHATARPHPVARTVAVPTPEHAAGRPQGLVHTAATRLADEMSFRAPASSDDAVLLAGAALLLLVGAAVSLLRLSARFPDELFRGRTG